MPLIKDGAYSTSSDLNDTLSRSIGSMKNGAGNIALGFFILLLYHKKRPHAMQEAFVCVYVYLENKLNTSFSSPVNVINVSYSRDLSVELVV